MTELACRVRAALATVEIRIPPRRRAAAAVVVAALVSIGAAAMAADPPPALADYTITMCQNGSNAPWGGSSYAANFDNCPTGGQMVFGGTQSSPAIPGNTTWGASLAVPGSLPSLSVKHATFTISDNAGETNPGTDAAWGQLYDYPGYQNQDTWFYPGSPDSRHYDFDLPAGSTGIALNLYCSNNPAGCDFTNNVFLGVGSITFGVHDSAAPTAGAFGGPILSGAAQRGAQTVSYTASDVGSGVRSVGVYLDNALVGSADYGQSCAYDTWAPCPGTKPDTVNVDTTAVHDGAHTLKLAVTDASGNANTVVAGTVTTANAPLASGVPTVSGAARVGQALTGSDTSFTAPAGTGAISTSSQWLRCDDQGSSCAQISGAVGLSYILQSADLGHTIRYVDLAADNDGAASSRSSASAVVSVDPPAADGTPTLAGSLQVGATLTGGDTSFTTAPGGDSVTVSREWLQCDDVGQSCAVITGATLATYTVQAGDVNRTLRFADVASDGGGTTVAQSAPSAVIAPAGSAAGGSGGLVGVTSSVSGGGGSGLAAPVPAPAPVPVSGVPAAVALGAANGSAADEQAAIAVRWHGTASATRVRAPYGRTHLVDGRLINSAGIPIGGAIVGVLATPESPGSGQYAEGTVLTRSDGTFSYASPASGPSRALSFTYRAHALSPSIAAEAQLDLEVPAAIVLGIVPRHVHVGSVIRISGHLPGPLPAGGKLVLLQARTTGGSGWITFNAVRTDAYGRFHAGYRFHYPGPASYQLRALSSAEADYPYLSGSSAPITVIEK